MYFPTPLRHQDELLAYASSIPWERAPGNPANSTRSAVPGDEATQAPEAQEAATQAQEATVAVAPAAGAVS